MMTYMRCILLILITGFTTPAISAPWAEQAKKLFENDHYEEVIELVNNHKRDRDQKLALMLLTFSHLQIHEFNDTKTDKKKFDEYYEALEDVVNAKHLNNIQFFSEQTDKPEVVNQARNLLKQAFENIKKIEKVALVIPFTEVGDEKTRELAFETLENIVSVKRKYVENGGTLRVKDINVMKDQRFIHTLLDNILLSSAYNTLVDIEEPVLAYISNYSGKNISKLQTKIDKEITNRKKKYPNSTWYSANSNGPIKKVGSKSSSPAWVAKAVELFERQEYEDVIKVTKEHKRDKKNNMGLMMLAFSHLQLYQLDDINADKKAASNYFDLLEDKVGVSDLEDLYFFIQQIDKEEVIDEGRDLLKIAFKNASDITEVPIIYPFVDAVDQKTRKLALSRLEEIIGAKRKYIAKGGTLRDKDITIFQDERLIHGLLNAIEESDAFKALQYIEAPVLGYLFDVEESKLTLKLEDKINKAISKREKKFPNSSWYSATGKVKKAANY